MSIGNTLQIQIGNKHNSNVINFPSFHSDQTSFSFVYAKSYTLLPNLRNNLVSYCSSAGHEIRLLWNQVIT